MGQVATTKTAPVELVSETRVDMIRTVRGRRIKLDAAPITVDPKTKRVEQEVMSSLIKSKGEVKFLTSVQKHPEKWHVEDREYIKQVINLPPRSPHKGKGVVRFGEIPKHPVGAPRARKFKLHIGFVHITPKTLKAKFVKHKLITIRTAPHKDYPAKFTFPLKKGKVMVFWTNKAAVKFIQDNYKPGDKLVTVGQPMKASEIK